MKKPPTETAPSARIEGASRKAKANWQDEFIVAKMPEQKRLAIEQSSEEFDRILQHHRAIRAKERLERERGVEEFALILAAEKAKRAKQKELATT